jgi:hypothetical protein
MKEYAELLNPEANEFTTASSTEKLPTIIEESTDSEQSDNENTASNDVPIDSLNGQGIERKQQEGRKQPSFTTTKSKLVSSKSTLRTYMASLRVEKTEMVTRFAVNAHMPN